MERTGLAKIDFNRKVEQIARQDRNNRMRTGQYKPLPMCRKDAKAKVEELHFITAHRKYMGMREYDYLVNRAVECGEGTIFYKGRTISIM